VLRSGLWAARGRWLVQRHLICGRPKWKIPRESDDAACARAPQIEFIHISSIHFSFFLSINSGWTEFIPFASIPYVLRPILQDCHHYSHAMPETRFQVFARNLRDISGTPVSSGSIKDDRIETTVQQIIQKVVNQNRYGWLGHWAVTFFVCYIRTPFYSFVKLLIHVTQHGKTCITVQLFKKEGSDEVELGDRFGDDIGEEVEWHAPFSGYTSMPLSLIWEHGEYTFSGEEDLIPTNLAAKAIEANFGPYHLLRNNCQTFTLRLLKETCDVVYQSYIAPIAFIKYKIAIKRDDKSRKRILLGWRRRRWSEPINRIARGVGTLKRTAFPRSIKHRSVNDAGFV
jgi:hypothetical protein